MLLVPPTSRAHSAEPLVPPTAENNNSRSPAHSNLVAIKAEPPHLLQYPPAPSPQTDKTLVRPHMSGLSDAQYPPTSTATHSAPTTPAPPSTPTPAPNVTASSDRSGSGGSASCGPLSVVPPSVGGGPPSTGVLAAPPQSTSAGPVGVSGVVGVGGVSMPVPGPSVGQQTATQAPLHHPLLGYVPHGNKILSRNLNGTREYNNRPNYPPPPMSQSDRRAAEPIRRSQDYGLAMAVTSQPSSESELQLYRVLQRANLLNYYDTFISQGGDDVQQLCEAGEEEFLEIMALVGMASKPLHVRRLQKALQEWVSNPAGHSNQAMFQIPLVPNLPPSVVAAGFPPLTARALLGTATPTPTPTRPSPPMSSSSIHPNHNSSPGIGKDSLAIVNSNSLGSGGGGLRDGGGGVMPPGITPGVSPGVSVSTSTPSTPSIPSSTPGCNTGPRDGPLGMGAGGMGGPMPGLGSGPPGGMGGGIGGSRGPSPHHTSPTHPGVMPPTSVSLQNCHGTMPTEKNAEIFLPFIKYIMSMSEDDPRRMEEIRKYAAIYGRFDCKRKPEKPLTLHEVSVNEAAAQICKYMPALLTRRDELFPLARQAVRDSGYPYSKGHSRSQTVVGAREDEPRNKRTRSDSGHDAGDLKNDLQWKKRQERLEAISEELRHMSERAEEVRTTLNSGGGDVSALTSQMDALQSRHAQLTVEQNELLKAQRKAKSDRVSVCSEERERGEDSDSQFSYSGASSPSQQLVQDTLVDEGLRVVKESLNQQKDAAAVVSRAQDVYPRPQQDGATTGGGGGAGGKHSNSTGGAPTPNVPVSTPTSSSSASGRLVSPPTTYSEMFSYPENKVLSSSQGNIIAVTNPALSMSAAMASSQLSDEERHISALYTLSQTVGAAQAARSNSIKQEPNSPGATKQE